MCRILVEKLLGLQSFGRQSMHSKEDNTEVDIKHVVMITVGQLLRRVCLFVCYCIDGF